jgi:hypothetical protein
LLVSNLQQQGWRQEARTTKKPKQDPKQKFKVAKINPHNDTNIIFIKKDCISQISKGSALV